MCNSIISKPIPYERPKALIVGTVNTVTKGRFHVRVVTQNKEKREFVENFPCVNSKALDEGGFKDGDRVKLLGEIVKLNFGKENVEDVIKPTLITKPKSTDPDSGMGKLVGRLTLKQAWNYNPQTGQNAWGWATFACSDNREDKQGLTLTEFHDDMKRTLDEFKFGAGVKVVGFLKHRPNPGQEKPRLRINAGRMATEQVTPPDPTISDPFLAYTGAEDGMPF